MKRKKGYEASGTLQTGQSFESCFQRPVVLLKAIHLHCGPACLEVVENTICEPHDCLCRPKMKL